MKWQGPKLSDDWKSTASPCECQKCKSVGSETTKANCTNISLMKERGLPLLTKSIYYSAIFFYPHNCGIRVWYFCCSKFFFFSWTLCSVFWEEVKEIAYFIASLVQSYESTVVGQWALLTSFSALSFSPILMYFCSLFVEE